MAGSVGAVMVETVGVGPEQPGAVVPKPPEAARASSDEELEKKSAWNRPSNGSVEAGSVMGAKSWPALSESSRVSSPKPSSSDFPNNVTEGSESELPGAPDSDHLTRPTSTTNPNSSGPTRHRTYRRVPSGAGSSSGLVPNGEPAMQSPSPQEGTPAVSGRNDQSRDPSNRYTGNWDRGSRPDKLSLQNGRNEPHRAYSNAAGHRRSNNGGGPHKKLGTRREQDHRPEWRPHLNARDMQFPQQHHHRPFHRPVFHAPTAGPVSFINHPPVVPVRPYIVPVPDMYHPMLYIHAPPTPPQEIYHSYPFVSSPTMYYPAPDYQLSSALLKQIHYYFSDENLCKDMFLRQNMNEEGWVPISLIANFNRVKSLTTDIPFILDTVGSSSILEVQDDKIRRRGDWKHWIWHSQRTALADAMQDLQMQYSSMNLQQT